VSLLLHAGLYAMGFRPPDFPPSQPSPTFDITMVAPQNSKAPDDADFMANANQLGSGSKSEKSRLKSQFAANEENLDFGADEVTAEKTVAEVIPKLEPEILTTKGKTNKFIDKLPEQLPEEAPVVETLDNTEQTQAIAKLIAEMSSQEEAFAKRPRIHFIDSLSAKGSGSKILDNAALNIVKLAAPYEPLPKAIRAKYDRLNITRTIVFHKENNEKAIFSSN